MSISQARARELARDDVALLKDAPIDWVYDTVSQIQGLPDSPAVETEEYFEMHWDPRDIMEVVFEPYIDFVVGWSNEDHNSYWAAVSTLLWGSGDFWPWTKAHHYLWFRQALDDIRNPRHTLYSRLEEGFGLLSFLSGQVSVRGISMATITSDLYGIYLVIFSDIPELPVQTRGSYGAPHRFLYVTNHIQFGPMRPLVDRPSEYHYTYLTHAVTKDYIQEPAITPKDSLFHPWRSDFPEDGVPEALFPTPRMPDVKNEDLRRAIGPPKIDNTAGKTTMGMSKYVLSRMTHDELIKEYEKRDMPVPRNYTTKADKADAIVQYDNEHASAAESKVPALEQPRITDETNQGYYARLNKLTRQQLQLKVEQRGLVYVVHKPKSYHIDLIIEHEEGLAPGKPAQQRFQHHQITKKRKEQPEVVISEDQSSPSKRTRTRKQKKSDADDIPAAKSPPKKPANRANLRHNIEDLDPDDEYSPSPNNKSVGQAPTETTGSESDSSSVTDTFTARSTLSPGDHADEKHNLYKR